jgi:nucleotide-binding universal stress UspA family protein
MKRFQHLYAFLDLRDDDQSLLRWVEKMAHMAAPSRVTLLHCWNALSIPAPVRQQYPWLLEPGEATLRARAEELVARHLRQLPPGTALEIVIKQGNTLATLLDELSRQQADLVVVKRDTGDFSLAEKLARKAPCSVLGIPTTALVKCEHILVPTDFSEYSRQALEIGCAFASASQARLSLLHAYEVPYGRQRAHCSDEQLAHDVKHYLAGEMDREAMWAAERGLPPTTHLVESALPAGAIARTAEQQGCDFVVIGCRGHGAVYATLLGSTAESILQRTPVPVLAVKAKGSGLSLLAQLRQLSSS